MPADYHMPPPTIEMCGRFSVGRFGWFIPKKLLDNNDFPSVISYEHFTNTNITGFDRFVIDSDILDQFKKLVYYLQSINLI